MTTYIDKKSNVFMVAQKIIIPTRSEARMKNYISATDARAWCDIVEDRRQHILEYAAKNKEGFCLDKFIPLEIIFNTMLAGKNLEINRLRQKMRSLEKCIDIYSKIELTQEQRRQLGRMRSEMKKISGKITYLQCVSMNEVFDTRKRQPFGESVVQKSPYNKCRIAQVNTIKNTRFTTTNELLKKGQPRKLYLPYPRQSDKGCMREVIDCRIQVDIGEDRRDICTGTDSMIMIRNFKKETRCQCTNTNIINCEHKLIETIDECMKLAARQKDQQKYCCKAISCHIICPREIICPPEVICPREVICPHEALCSRKVPCAREVFPCEEDSEIELDYCYWDTDSLDGMDIGIKEVEEDRINECKAMLVMKRELEKIRSENRKQLQIAQKMIETPTDCEQLQNIFNQSECVRRISEELEKQYQQWNQMRHKKDDIMTKVEVRCRCVKSIELPNLTDSQCSINLEQELEVIEKEKEKLKKFVSQMQGPDIPECLFGCLKSDHTKLQEQLQKEIIYRKYLEQTLVNVLN